jgi:hypothetical protein
MTERDELLNKIKVCEMELEKLSMRECIFIEIISHFRSRMGIFDAKRRKLKENISDLKLQIQAIDKSEEWLEKEKELRKMEKEMRGVAIGRAKKKLKEEKTRTAQPEVSPTENTVSKAETTNPEKSATDKFNEKYSKAIQNGTAKEQDNSINN